MASSSLTIAGLWQQALQPFAQGVNGAITLAAASAMRRSRITLRSSGSALSTSAGRDSPTMRCSLRWSCELMRRSFSGMSMLAANLVAEAAQAGKHRGIEGGGSLRRTHEGAHRFLGELPALGDVVLRLL